MPKYNTRPGWVRGMSNYDRYYWLKERGLCPKCGAPGSGQYVMCDACREKQKGTLRALYAKRKEKGRCVTCGARLSDRRHTRCPVCRAYWNTVYKGTKGHTGPTDRSRSDERDV